MELFKIIVEGHHASVYESSIWILSVRFDPDTEEVFSVDPLGDSDWIGDASTPEEADTVARDYFKGYEIY